MCIMLPHATTKTWDGMLSFRMEMHIMYGCLVSISFFQNYHDFRCEFSHILLSYMIILLSHGKQCEGR
jgi:hypothetical protein